MDEITHRRVRKIALPIVLSNATAPIGAVGVGAVMLASVCRFFGFLRMGISGLVAQAHGGSGRR